MGNTDPYVLLKPEENRLYADALAAEREQEAVVRRREAEYRQARLLLTAIGRERARIWTHLCATHGLDLETTYTMDEAGRISPVEESAESCGEVDPAD